MLGRWGGGGGGGGEEGVANLMTLLYLSIAFSRTDFFKAQKIVSRLNFK